MDRTFWSHWGDGQAEISAYELTYPRYGALRSGVAVAIFVTEPFSYEARVKADPGKHAPGDVFPVIKLNLVQDFQTGIYDYNEQTSSYLSLRSLNSPAATSPRSPSPARRQYERHRHRESAWSKARFTRGGSQSRYYRRVSDGVGGNSWRGFARHLGQEEVPAVESVRELLQAIHCSSYAVYRVLLDFRRKANPMECLDWLVGLVHPDWAVDLARGVSRERFVGS